MPRQKTRHLPTAGANSERYYPGYRSYIKLYKSSVTLCHLFPFNPLTPAYWHQEEPLGYSVFAEAN